MVRSMPKNSTAKKLKTLIGSSLYRRLVRGSSLSVIARVPTEMIMSLMRACASLVTVGSFFISSRYSSSVPRHSLHSQAARSFLITCSKLLTSAIGKLLVGRAIRFVGSFQESEALTYGVGGLCYFLSASLHGV